MALLGRNYHVHQFSLWSNLSVVPISSYKRNNGRRRFKTGFRAGFPLCLEVFVVWEITPTQRSFPISTVAALLRKHISCSCRSTCSTKRTTERLSTHRRRRSLQAVIVDRQRSHVETKWYSFDLNNLFQYTLQIYGRHNVLIHKPNVYLPSSCWCLDWVDFDFESVSIAAFSSFAATQDEKMMLSDQIRPCPLFQVRLRTTADE